jgi:hypothetical protein
VTTGENATNRLTERSKLLEKYVGMDKIYEAILVRLHRSTAEKITTFLYKFLCAEFKKENKLYHVSFFPQQKFFVSRFIHLYSYVLVH